MLVVRREAADEALYILARCLVAKTVSIDDEPGGVCVDECRQELMRLGTFLLEAWKQRRSVKQEW